MALLPPLKKFSLRFKYSDAQKRPEENPLARLLPQEVQQLKMQILQTHPESLMRFSMSSMGHVVALPPVEIPPELRKKNVASTKVSGHNMKKKYQKRQLDIIGEGVHYQ